MWDKTNIEKDITYYSSIGNLRLWINKSDKEWKVLKENSGITEVELIQFKEVDKKTNGEWSTIIADKSNVLCLMPALPDKAIAIKPENPYTLLPNCDIQLFIRIPVWVQLYAGTVKPERLIAEFPSIELSSTWLGEPDNGILGYGIKCNLESQLNKEDLSNYEILCPVKVSNDSNIPLDFQRFLLHVDQLSIYSDNKYLYSNEVHVKFKGENIPTDINYSSQSPSFISHAKKIASPRDGGKKSVLKRSFYFFKSLTQY